ncbi:MAG: hypothetical protein JWN46_2973 [Acidimicrobiales bacterium]|nr:hypothetical protein [Acidimicrobiales bacterium]
MVDRTFTADETAAGFRFASSWWCSLVGAVEASQWEDLALGEWTLRELVVHTDRAFRTVLDYVEGDVKDPTELPSAAAYFRTVLAEETPHVHIAARARREAVDVVDPIAHTDHLAELASATVERLPPETSVHTFVGEIRLDQYLATRIVELVIHGIDLSEAIGILTSPPPAAAHVALSVLTDLVPPSDLAVLLRALSGRSQLLPGLHVLD